MNIYSEIFLNKINLKFIVICKDLEVASIPALGVPNHALKTIIININIDDYKLSRTIHHEIFHVINDQYINIFKTSDWESLNSYQFKYADCSTCTDKYGMELVENKKFEQMERDYKSNILQDKFLLGLGGIAFASLLVLATQI